MTEEIWECEYCGEEFSTFKETELHEQIHVRRIDRLTEELEWLEDTPWYIGRDVLPAFYLIFPRYFCRIYYINYI